VGSGDGAIKMDFRIEHGYCRGPAYGQRIQYASPEDNLPLLDKLGIIRVQSINGTFLYYARAVDPTMLVALNEISQQQSKPTAATLKKCDRLMDYAATYPNAVIRYHWIRSSFRYR